MDILRDAARYRALQENIEEDDAARYRALQDSLEEDISIETAEDLDKFADSKIKENSNAQN